MLFHTVGQGWVFLWMAASGALIGAWYACTAALRRLLSAGIWLSLAIDGLFGLGTAAIFCLALVSANGGQPRLYAAGATALGCLMFVAGLYPPGKCAIKAINDAICRIVVKIRRYRWIKVIFK